MFLGVIDMLNIDEILKISDEMGIEVRDSKSGKHYILDDSGKEVEFNTGMLINLEKEDVSYKLDLNISRECNLGKFSSQYILATSKDIYISNPSKVDEFIIYAA